MMGRRHPADRRSREQQQPITRLPLPFDVAQVANNGNRCENIGLWLDKYLAWDLKDDGEWKLTEGSKQRKRVIEMSGSQQVQKFVDALNARFEAQLQWVKSRYGQDAVREFQAEPVWRFVVGLGAAHVLETGITLHRIFGLPIIPASGLKGAARAYALYELADELGIPVLSPAEAKEMEEKTPLQKLEELVSFFAAEPDSGKRRAEQEKFLQSQLLPPDAPIRKLDSETLAQKLLPFAEVFGTTERAGKVIFLDAVPLEVPKFELDIMNPHSPDYYRNKGEGGAAPSDWQSPTPVFFLTVSKTRYKFAIAARTKDAVNLLCLAERWLKGALRELGIGAKTSANYGYWNFTARSLD